jgi:hypothetical protein
MPSGPTGVHDGLVPSSDRTVRATARLRDGWRGASAAAATTGAVLAGAGRRLGRVGRGVRRLISRLTQAGGAGESGLSALIELHAISSAGDMLITVALAGTLFFGAPTSEARGHVALYLLVTMAPFVVLAPLIGPLLDHFRRGRRYALAATMLARAFLCWVLADSLHSSLALYPAALGALVASKAYGVTRSAAIPRLIPSGGTLVKANSRATLAGLAATALAAPVGAGLSLIGHGVALRFAVLVFGAGMVLALRLPARVDSSAGEQAASLAAREPSAATRTPRGSPSTTLVETLPGQTTPLPTASADRGRSGGVRFRAVGPAVLLALRANLVLRAFAGFLTLFLAFLLREHPIGGLSGLTALGLVAVAAGAGNALGAAAGAVLRSRAPEAIIVGMLAIAAATAVLAALRYGVVTVTLLAAAAGFCQALGKLALDALIQREIAERVRTSAFARSETWIQLAWVAGGGLGIVLPLNGEVGLGLAAIALTVMVGETCRALLRTRAQRPTDAAREPAG